MEELTKMSVQKYTKANSLPDWQQYYCRDIYKACKSLGTKQA